MDGDTRFRKVKAERKENADSAIDKRREEIKRSRFYVNCMCRTVVCLCNSECLLCVHDLVCVWVMLYVCVHDEVCVCIMWCFACHNLYYSECCF